MSTPRSLKSLIAASAITISGLTACLAPAEAAAPLRIERVTGSLPVTSYPTPKAPSQITPRLVPTRQGQLIVVGPSTTDTLVSRFGLDGSAASTTKVPVWIGDVQADELGRLWYLGLRGLPDSPSTELGVVELDGTSRTVHVFGAGAEPTGVAPAQGGAWVYDRATATLERFSESGELAATISSPALKVLPGDINTNQDTRVRLLPTPDGGVWMAGGGLMRNVGGTFGGPLAHAEPSGPLVLINPLRRSDEKSISAFRLQQDLTGTQRWAQLSRASKNPTVQGTREVLAYVSPSGQLVRVPTWLTQGTHRKPWYRLSPPDGLMVAPDAVGGIWAIDPENPRIRYFNSGTGRAREFRANAATRFDLALGTADAAFATDGNLWILGRSKPTGAKDRWTLIKIDTP